MNTKATKASYFIPQLRKLAQKHGLNIKKAAHFKLCLAWLNEGTKSN